MWLCLILVLAAFLRLFHLGSLPISLFGDEIDVGYHALSLWTTGRDYMGHLLPTYIQSLSEWRAPLLMYVTAPFVGLLGLNTFAVRLPVALLGISNIYLIYLLTNQLFKNLEFKNLKLFGIWNLEFGILPAFLLAITPWHIHYSRAAFEVTLLLSLLLLGTYWFIKYLNTKYFTFYLLPFTLTLYTYSTANLFTPLLILSLFIIYRPNLKILLSRQTIPYFLFSFLLLLPIAYQILLGPAAGRFKMIGLFNDPKVYDDIIIQRTDPLLGVNYFDQFFYNRPVTYLTAFGRQYIQAFSPQFLFLEGDTFFRQSIGRFGELPWFLFPLIIVGILTLFSPPKLGGEAHSAEGVLPRNGRNLILSWLILSPLPSALTQGGSNHATRLFIMLPPLIILSSLGFIKTFEFIKNLNIKLLFVICNLLFVICATYYVAAYWHRYSTHYRLQSGDVWSYGYQEAFKLLKDLKPSGRVFINNTAEPSLIRFAFYTSLPPKDFHNMFKGDVPQKDILPDFDGFQFGDQYYFGQIKYPDRHRIQDSYVKLLKPGDVYLAVQLKEIDGAWDWLKNPPEGLKGVGQVKNLDQTPLFTWVSLVEK